MKSTGFVSVAIAIAVVAMGIVATRDPSADSPEKTTASIVTPIHEAVNRADEPRRVVVIAWKGKSRDGKWLPYGEYEFDSEVVYFFEGERVGKGRSGCEVIVDELKRLPRGTVVHVEPQLAKMPASLSGPGYIHPYHHYPDLCDVVNALEKSKRIIVDESGPMGFQSFSENLQNKYW